MDNKPRESEAEDYVKSLLLRYNFKVVKPSFDQQGADLIIVDSIDKKYSRFILVQSKGRSIQKSAEITIPTSYVTDQFIVFIYTIDESFNANLYLFFAEDIRQWRIRNNVYILTVSKTSVQSTQFSSAIFNERQAESIRLLLVKAEVKKYTSVLLDGIFIEKALNKTIAHYNELYPEKTLRMPELNDVINEILNYYDKYNAEEKTINCYLFLSESFSLENVMNVKQENHSFYTKNGNLAKVFINKTNEIIVFEVLEQLDRLINTDNIILVADDQAYVNALADHMNNGVDIIIVGLHEDDGGQMLAGFRWGELIYPLALAMGLSRHEL